MVSNFVNDERLYIINGNDPSGEVLDIALKVIDGTCPKAFRNVELLGEITS